MTMPAGTYWIGDLCYVMHGEWDEFCDLTIVGRGVLNGEFNLKDGRRFATYRTLYGDGVYTDSDSNFDYGVDAGLIGCILLSDIDTSLEENLVELGRVVHFENNFETKSAGEGVIMIGHVMINTGTDEEFRDEYEEDYNY